MKKVVVFQSPAHLFEVVPPFYQELNKLGYFDDFYLATDKRERWGLGENVHITELEQDLGWEGNLAQLLERVPEDLFVMMCDDHVTVTQTEMNLDRYFAIMQRTPRLGRLQLSPPTRNYYRFLKAHGQPIEIPDDRREWYPYDVRYRWHVNFQASIWRKEFLREIIAGGGNRSQLELRASERARRSSNYISGYIGQHAVRYENFLASCQVHHTDPDFHKKKKTSHYREEFVRYAMKRPEVRVDQTKRVHVRRAGFSASVPVGYYIEHYENQAMYRNYAIRRPLMSHILFRLSKRVRAKIAPYTSASSR